MSSRYTSSYTSRYGSGRDYGTSAYSSSRDRDSSSYRDRDSTYSSSRYSSRPKYSSYASKYSTDLGKSTDKMEDYTAAPIAKDEIEELSYDAKTPTTPTEEVAPPQEVLQESQISDFVEDEDDKPTEVEEVKLTLASEVEEEDEDDEEDEVRRAQELLAASTQIREASPVPSPVSSPVKEVSFVAETLASDSGKEAENRTPSPTVLNAKKLGGIPWPPKSSDVKKEGGEAEALPKKRVSDLIARFNTGIVEESKKTDDSYKNEYGAGTNVGKVSTHNFA